MYKAIKLYPLMRNGKIANDERIVLTDGAVRRLNRIWQWQKENDIDTRKLARIFDVSLHRIYRYRKGQTYPLLSSYLRIMYYLQKLKVVPDIYHDINYIYANVKYTPEDIAQRVKRLYDVKGRQGRSRHHGRNIGYSDLARELGYAHSNVIAALHYGKARIFNVYAQCMFYIASEEKRLGLPNRLRIEY